MLTLAEAARETGLTKPAIFKSIQKGKISATKDEKGQWLIDPAELFRVYAPAAKKETAETQTG
jgi:excisionase family DNA binding protein